MLTEKDFQLSDFLIEDKTWENENYVMFLLCNGMACYAEKSSENTINPLFRFCYYIDGLTQEHAGHDIFMQYVNKKSIIMETQELYKRCKDSGYEFPADAIKSIVYRMTCKEVIDE